MRDQGANSLDWLAARLQEGAASSGFQGLDIERGDGHLIIRNALTTKEHEEWLAEAKAQREDIQSRMIAIAEQLDQQITRFNPLDTIAHIAWINSLHDAENWDEHQFEGNDVYTEYVALLCLTHKLADFDDPGPDNALAFNGPAVQELAKDLFRLSALEDQLEPATRDGPPTTEQELRFLTLLHEVGVRYPGSSEHLHAVLEGLLAPVSDALAAELGFAADHALALDRGIFSLVNKRLSDKITAAVTFQKELRKAVKRYRQKGRPSPDYDEGLLASLAQMKPSEAMAQIRGIAATWVFLFLGRTMAFSAEELAEEAGVGTAETQAFLDFYSLEFGDVDGFFRLPRPTHPLQNTPIIRFPEAGGIRFLSPVFQAVGWAIRPGIEEKLRGDASAGLEALRRDYEASKSSYLEGTAFELLSSLLQPAPGLSYRGAKYRRVEGDEETTFEIDGLFIIDDILVLLEAKSGGMRPSARRGGPQSMRENLEELVGKAAEQTAAAWDFFLSSPAPVLELPDGTTWSVPMKDISQVFRICVTLEDLTVFATNIHRLEAIGLVTLDTPLWAVSIYDLMVMRDLIDLPPVFVHYLASRFEIEKLRCVHGYCELDHLSCYLLGDAPYTSLPDGLPENTKIVLDPSYSALVDNWYFYLQGARKTRPPKPERKIPQAFRGVLESLQTKRPSHYMSMSLLLLDLPDAAQADLAHALADLDEKTRSDGKRHDLSIVPPNWNLGVTVATSMEDTVDQLARRLETYCLAKKHQLRRDNWIGIGSISSAEEPVQLMLLLDDPWKPDPKLDELVATLLPSAKEGRTSDGQTP